jgi:protein-disulfide isomerase
MNNVNSKGAALKTFRAFTTTGAAAILALSLSGCFMTKDSLKKMLKENPDILTEAIEENPAKIMDALNNAVRKAQQQQFEDREKGQSAERDEEFKNPKVAVIDDTSVIWGNKDAVITVVEYSDFECPYCKRGHATVEEVMKKYGDKVRVVFKNLPLDFHPMAMPSAKYFAAIAMQGADKAKKFYDNVFESQAKLTTHREKFLDESAKKAGADMAKLKKDIASDEVKKRIDADMEEAKKFGFNGTPGFLVNGVSIKGAYPVEEFSKIIDQHLAAKK